MESEGLSIIDTPPFRAGYCVPEAYIWKKYPNYDDGTNLYQE